jgi:chemotaxis signal transduction protein
MEQVLVFRIGERLCGLDVVCIREIVEDPVCHYVPRTPEWCEGAIHVHGQVLPVVDLPGLLGSPAGQRDHRCIVLDVAPATLALRVSAIHRILRLEEDAVLLPKDAAAGPLAGGALQIEDWRFDLLDAGDVLQEVKNRMGEAA